MLRYLEHWIILPMVLLNLLIQNSCSNVLPLSGSEQNSSSTSDPAVQSGDQKMDLRLSVEKNMYNPGESINIRYYVNQRSMVTMWVTMPNGSRYRYFSNIIRNKGSYEYNLYATWPPGNRLVTVSAVSLGGQACEVAACYSIR
jgi:hypothetical protein